MVAYSAYSLFPIITHDEISRKKTHDIAVRINDILRVRHEARETNRCSQCENMAENSRLQQLEINALRESIERFEELCQCPICYNNYIDNLPVILNCGHVVCKMCCNVLRECHACRSTVVKSEIRNIYFV